jgi:hypothetical protein
MTDEELKPEGTEGETPPEETPNEEETTGTEEELTPPAEETFDEDAIDDDVKNYKPGETPKTPDSDDDIDPEDEARIAKIVDKRFGPQLKEMQKKAETDAFFGAHPEYKKYRTATEKYMAHPTYSGVPIHNLVAIVSSKDAQKIGAAKERAAQRRVAETVVPGSSTRPVTPGKTNWHTAPKADFEAQKAKVLGRPSLN